MRGFVICLLAAAALAIPGSADAAVVVLGTYGEQSGRNLLALPDGITVDNAGTVWVADRDNNRIERFSNGGRLEPFLPPFRRRHLSAAPGRFNLPYDVVADPLGNLYVADTHNHRIQEFTPSGKLIRIFGSHGTGPGQLDQPRDLAIDPFGNVWVADHENKRVVKFSADGRFLGQFGRNGGDGSYGNGPGEFNSPRGLSSDDQGNIYVADDANHRIVKLANDGSFIKAWGTQGTGDGQVNLPYGTAVDRSGHVWIADTNDNRLDEFTLDGVFVAKFGSNFGDGSPGSAPGEFRTPYNVATDCVGNVYVTDVGNHRVQKLGDPAAPRPVCPPAITGLTVTGSARAATVSVTCDRPCRLAATGTAPGGVRLRRGARVLTAGGRATLRLAAPRAAAGKRARILVTASGAPGATRSAARTVRLGR